MKCASARSAPDATLKSLHRPADLEEVARNVEVVAPTGAERRTSIRVDFELEVGLETDNNFYTGLTQDVSSGGLFVATHQLRKRGERLTVRFTLPGGQPITVEAEVRWIREVTSLSDGRHHENPTGMGLKFINLPAPTKAAIAAFLKQRDSIFFDDE
jgi:uncharacterized protein (TIGR02266 family)